MTLNKNQLIELSVTDINMMGFGVAKHEDAVVFVQNAVPGDVALCRIIKCAKKYYVARIEKLTEASKERVDAPCPYFRRCGGCNFQHVSYELECCVKKEYVKNCLRKEGLSDVEVADVLSTGATCRYRNKAQFPLATDEEGNIVFGFYSTKTHRVCPIEDCLIQDESFSLIAKEIVCFLSENNVSVYNEELGQGLVRHIYLRRAFRTGEIMLCLVLTEENFPKKELFCKQITEKFPQIKSIVFNINPDNTNVILGKTCHTVYGKSSVRDVLCGREFDLSPLSFYQVNHDGAELLYRTAFSLVEKDFDLLIDLYCGIGTIGICSCTDKPILGVEIVPEAVEDAKRNAALNNISNAKYICGDAKDAFSFVSDSGASSPLLVVDPPRKGLSLDLIEDIARHEISQVLYISCGPDTLARDLKAFREAGYLLGKVQPVDMFSRTGHVESICLLTKK